MARSHDVDIHDHTAAAPAPPEPKRPDPLNPEEDARLRHLRARIANPATPPLSEEEKAEMDKLAQREAEAAGHFVAEPPKEQHPAELFMGDLLALIASIVGTVPQLHGLLPRVNLLRVRYDEMCAK